MIATINRNTEKNGIEIFFDTIPSRGIIDSLKAVGYRWHNVKKCWYAKASEETENAARSATEGIEATKTTASTNTHNNIEKHPAPLWERVQYTAGSGADKCHAHTVGSRYKAGMKNKEIAAEVKKHLAARFPECKFSASSTGYRSIRIEIKSGEFEKDSAELEAIREYAKNYLESYNYNDSDSMTDYFDYNFYGSVSISYDYQQTETENTAKTCEAFRQQKEAAETAAREREEKEIVEQIERRKKEEEEYRRIEAENRAKVAEIEAAATVIEYAPEIVRDVYAREVRKASTIKEAREMIDEYSNDAPQLCRVSRAVILPSALVDAFGSLPMYDYSFLSGQGGHGTDDARVNSNLDFQHMTQAERNTVEWFNHCTAIIESESRKVKFLVNPEGYNYARYVYILPENAAFTEPQSTDISESIAHDIQRAAVVEDISTYIIENSDTITSENWQTSDEYREQMKKCVPALDVNMIRQITIEPLKEWLYKEHARRLSLGVQAENLSDMIGEKITISKINDFGMVSTCSATLHGYSLTNYAQYSGCLRLAVSLPKKRGQYEMTLTPSTPFVIAHGSFDIPDSVLYDVSNKNGVICKSSKYSSCDRRQITDIKQYIIDNGGDILVDRSEVA